MNNEDKKTKCECAKLDLLLVCKHCDEDGDCNENRYRLYYRRKPRPGSLLLFGHSFISLVAHWTWIAVLARAQLI